MLAGFFTLFSIGFGADLANALRWPFWRVMANSACWDIFGILIATARTRNRKALFGIIPVVIVVFVVLPRIQAGLPLNERLMVPGFADLRWRLAMDGTLSIASVFVGFFLYVTFVGTQGVRHVRVRTELELAEKLQQTLAP